LQSSSFGEAVEGIHVHFREVFHQQPVDEDVSATDAALENQVNAVIKEGDKSPWEEVVNE
jgi:hypothetical protein